ARSSSSREHLVQPSLEVERILEDFIVAAIEDLAAYPQGLPEADGRARPFRVRLRDVERLREEPQKLSRALPHHRITNRLFFSRPRQQRTKTLSDPRDELDVIVIRNAIPEESRARSERIDRRIDPHSREIGRQANPHVDARQIRQPVRSPCP